MASLFDSTVESTRRKAVRDKAALAAAEQRTKAAEAALAAMQKRAEQAEAALAKMSASGNLRSTVVPTSRVKRPTTRAKEPSAVELRQAELKKRQAELAQLKEQLLAAQKAAEADASKLAPKHLHLSSATRRTKELQRRIELSTSLLGKR